LRSDGTQVRCNGAHAHASHDVPKFKPVRCELQGAMACSGSHQKQLVVWCNNTLVRTKAFSARSASSTSQDELRTNGNKLQNRDPPRYRCGVCKKGLECEMSIRSNVAAHQKNRHCITHCVLLLHAVPSFPFPYD
jgi:hypothetical protein